MAMSDTSGNLDGGVTNVITTGAAAEGAPSCNTTSPGIDFSFELDSALQQCAYVHPTQTIDRQFHISVL